MKILGVLQLNTLEQVGVSVLFNRESGGVLMWVMLGVHDFTDTTSWGPT